ncbi:UBN2_3 domain-containing protein [Cephalotus follicularis]|uniref:UBN2_3 domain-containing protein n=1 Tax=Cephalotus follicularis TaxID=3775 RepID=A0A1Q3D9J8_CEPFO|nr:UBN2_3 domain-containing protein [Cephalotus follicularis]
MASTFKKDSQIIHFNAPTHFPIKLAQHNFTVWRKQVHTTLIGYDCLGFFNGSTQTPSITLPNKSPDPAYSVWHRQDQILLSALLGSCTDGIKPFISNASTSKEAWDNLMTIFANKSRSRIMSLKESLTIAAFLQDMQAIENELALANNLVFNEDLVINVLTNLNLEFTELVTAVRVRDSTISLPELQDKLSDFELQLKKVDDVTLGTTNIPFTANYTQRNQYALGTYGRSPQSSNRQQSTGNPNARRFTPFTHSNSGSVLHQSRRFNNLRINSFCKFCNREGH